MRILKRNILFILLVIISLGFQLNAQTKSPEPISGFALTKKIMQHHLIYPQNALEKKKGGKIEVFFDLDKEGKASNFTVRNAFDDECAAEAIRLVRQIEWHPALKDGRATEYNDSYVVDFSPKGYKKSEEKSPRVRLPEQKYPRCS